MGKARRGSEGGENKRKETKEEARKRERKARGDEAKRRVRRGTRFLDLDTRDTIILAIFCRLLSIDTQRDSPNLLILSLTLNDSITATNDCISSHGL